MLPHRILLSAKKRVSVDFSSSVVPTTEDLRDSRVVKEWRGSEVSEGVGKCDDSDTDGVRSETEVEVYRRKNTETRKRKRQRIYCKKSPKSWVGLLPTGIDLQE